MKKIMALLIAGFLSAESLIIVDSLGLQRAKAEIDNTANVEIKLQNSNQVKLVSSGDSLEPSKQNGQNYVFENVSSGKWKIETSSKVVQVKIN